jgi:hypothetical protein
MIAHRLDTAEPALEPSRPVEPNATGELHGQFHGAYCMPRHKSLPVIT